MKNLKNGSFDFLRLSRPLVFQKRFVRLSSMEA